MRDVHRLDRGVYIDGNVAETEVTRYFGDPAADCRTITPLTTDWRFIRAATFARGSAGSWLICELQYDYDLEEGAPITEDEHWRDVENGPWLGAVCAETRM